MGRTMIVALIAFGMLPGCTDWREDEDTAELCLERWADTLFPLAGVAKADPSLKVFPTYTYDVSAMDQQALRDRIGAGRPFDPSAPQMQVTIAIGGDQTTYDKWLSRKVGEEGAYFESGEVQVLRERGQPVPFLELAAQGCARRSDNLRLLRIDYDFRGFASEDDASSQSGTITNTSSPQE